MLNFEKFIEALNSNNSNLNLHAIGKDFIICILGGILIGGYTCTKKFINRDSSYFLIENENGLK